MHYAKRNYIPPHVGKLKQELHSHLIRPFELIPPYLELFHTDKFNRSLVICFTCFEMEENEYLKANVQYLTILGFCPVEDDAPKKIKFFHFVCKNVFFYSLIIFSVQIVLDISQTQLKFDELGVKVVNICKLEPFCRHIYRFLKLLLFECISILRITTLYYIIFIIYYH